MAIYRSYKLSKDRTDNGAGYSTLSPITSVIADSAGVAAAHTEQELIKPGRKGYLKAWAADGYIMAEGDECRITLGAGTYAACLIVSMLEATEKHPNGSLWGKVTPIAHGQALSAPDAVDYFHGTLPLRAFMRWEMDGCLVRRIDD